MKIPRELFIFWREVQELFVVENFGVNQRFEEVELLLIIKPSWSGFRYSEDWGYTRLTIFNASTLHFEFLRNWDGSTYDEFWLHSSHQFQYQRITFCFSNLKGLTNDPQHEVS